MNPDPPSGLDAVAAAAADSAPAPDLRGGEAPAADAYDVDELGPDCPVTPLGFLKQRFHFLDAAGQHIELGSEFRKGELMALFLTRMAWLEVKWPQMKKVGERKTGETGDDGKPIIKPIFEEDGFSQRKAQEGLIMACGKAGIFDPRNKVRGRGAHRLKDGGLILHCGDMLVVGGRRGTRGQAIKSATFRPGLYPKGPDGHVYPTAEALAKPADVAAEVNIGMEIYRLFCSWRWKKGETDGERGKIEAYLLLCWLVAANYGGALKVRPHGWIVGPSGAGKTTLQDCIEALMNGWGRRCEDASAAGVRQLLDQDTLAVMFDEIEAEENNQDVVMQIVRLARLAYSGASAVRGSTDHQARQFVARSCFLFSSIHHHELPAQDRNRIAVLGLAPFPPQTEKLVLPATLAQWGDGLRRRLVEQWHRYDATLLRYQAEMLNQGYSGREQDTYGTLLACGDLALHDTPPRTIEEVEAHGGTDRVAKKVRELARIVDAQRAETIDTTEKCIGWLLSTRLPASAGREQETVSRWIARSLIAIHSVRIMAGQRKIPNPARDKLLNHGMRLVHLQKGHEDSQSGMLEAYLFDERENERDSGRLALDVYLAVPNQTNSGMREIFAKSAWASGNWSQPLALIAGAVTNKKFRFGGKPEGCTLVPIGEIIDVADVLSEARDTARQAALDMDAGGPAEQRG